MAKNDVGNFIGGLLNAVQQTYISERDKNRDQERLGREEARQEAVLSLQKLQNKQRVNEFNKSFEFTQNQANVDNIRNADKDKYDKLISQKTLFKQYANIKEMPTNTGDFVFKQSVPGTIDDEFTKQSGSDVLDNNEQYYDTDAYKNAYDMYLAKLNSDNYARQIGSSSNKGRIAVVHAPSGTVKLLKEEDYYKKVEEGFYPMDTWKPMTIEAASTYSMNQLGVDKSGKNLLNQNSTPGQVADVFQGAFENVDSQWFSKTFGTKQGETSSVQDILNRLKPSGLKTAIDDKNLYRGDDPSFWTAPPSEDKEFKAYNDQLWTKQKKSNTERIKAFIENVINPARQSIANSNTWKDTPAGRDQRKIMELQVANLVEPLKVAYQGVDTGLIDPSVKSDVYNALDFARTYARKNAVILELQKQNIVNTGLAKEEVKSMTKSGSGF